VLSVLSARRLPAAVVLLAGLVGTPASAQPPRKIKVTMVVILASEHSTQIDPRLKCIAEEVRKHDPTLRGFTLASMAWKSLAVNEKASFALVEETTADVVVHCCGDKNNRVCLGVTPPLQGEIVYRTVCGKFLPIVTRYQTRERIPAKEVVRALAGLAAMRPDGLAVAAAVLCSCRTRDRLILAVRVQPCNGK
jgi:hypothetical protein